ncbi:hypothetical protein FJZ55_01885 [Candidatus Woesearchaeota archaeon]|jgi:hypothetical protein|nr:hypothetical protein [Candidatus Woesearchaeota archaeon]
MRKIRLVLILTAALFGGCTATPEGYAAVHQVVSDPLIVYLGNSWYLAKERDGAFMLVSVDSNNEVAEIINLY